MVGVISAFNTTSNIEYDSIKSWIRLILLFTIGSIILSNLLQVIFGKSHLLFQSESVEKFQGHLILPTGKADNNIIRIFQEFRSKFRLEEQPPLRSVR